MKNINIWNYFMVGIPLVLGALGFIEPGCWFFGALFTMLTGAFQFIVGASNFIDSNARSIPYAIYLGGVAFFFSLWIFTDWYWIIGIPPALAIYISVLLFMDAKTQKP